MSIIVTCAWPCSAPADIECLAFLFFVSIRGAQRDISVGEMQKMFHPFFVDSALFSFVLRWTQSHTQQVKRPTGHCSAELSLFLFAFRLEIKQHNLPHKWIICTRWRAVFESQSSQINWLMYSNKFSAQDISWLQGSGTGLGMDLLLTGCPCVWVSVYATVCVCVCAWACMCIQWANVRPGTDRNLATVLCPCVPGELLSQQIKARCSYSLPYSQGHSYRPDHLLSEVYCQRCWWIWIEIMWISSIFLTQKEAWVLNKIRN